MWNTRFAMSCRVATFSTYKRRNWNDTSFVAMPVSAALEPRKYVNYERHCHHLICSIRRAGNHQWCPDDLTTLKIPGRLDWCLPCPQRGLRVLLLPSAGQSCLFQGVFAVYSIIEMAGRVGHEPSSRPLAVGAPIHLDRGFFRKVFIPT